MPFDLTSASFASLLATTSTTTAHATKSNTTSLVIFVLLIVGAYFFWIRPQRARIRARQAGTSGTTPGGSTAVGEGDTVVTTSGIIGRVVEIEGDRATLEIAPNTIVAMHRNALGRRIDVTDDAPSYEHGLGGSIGSGTTIDATAAPASSEPNDADASGSGASGADRTDAASAWWTESSAPTDDSGTAEGSN